LTPSRVDWCHGVVDQFGDQSAGRISESAVEDEASKLPQSWDWLGGAGKRISGPRRFEARGQAGRPGDARRWLVRAAPGLGGRNRYRQ